VAVVLALVVVLLRWRRRWSWAMRRMEHVEAERAAWVQIAADSAAAAEIFRELEDVGRKIAQQAADESVPVMDVWEIGPLRYWVVAHRN